MGLHIAEQFLEAWVGAQGISIRVAEIRQVGVMLFVGFFEPIDGQVVVTSLNICTGDSSSSYIMAWLPVSFCQEVR